MDAEQIVVELMKGSPNLLTLVPAAKIYPKSIPAGVPLPAIAFMHVSSVEIPTISDEPFTTIRSRIQVDIVAKNYGQQKQILNLVRLALNNKRGTIAGVRVLNVRREVVGSDNDDQLPEINSQPIEFMVTFRQPNS